MSLIQGMPNGPISDKNGKLLLPWLSWISSIYKQILLPVGQNGATTARPTTGLWVGQQFFDTTLGYPVWVKSLNPTVWVNGSGGVV